MAKDSLSEALLKVKDQKRKKGPRKSGPKPVKLRRGRPKAFDPFYLLCTILLVLSLALQVVALAVYA